MGALALPDGLHAWQEPAVPGPPDPKTLAANEWHIGALRQESEGRLRRLHSTPEGGGPIPYQAWVESSKLVFRADELEWNEETGDVRASGNVYFHDLDSNNELWCERLEYNTDKESGRFFKVRGTSPPVTRTRQDILTSSSPFYFEGAWAEREGGLYTVHDGFITNCRMPSPWWRLKGPKFQIAPGDRATSYKTVFWLRGVPLFYTPYFYHSLKEQPRKSGFLIPNLGHGSDRGFLVGVGYYWAINRSHDATYRVINYSSRGFAHHADFRGNPRAGTDYSAIIYGVNDRGKRNSQGELEKYRGASVYAVGQSQIGKGWTAHANVNYVSSLRFRGEWSQSYNEAIGSEIQSVGYLEKNFREYAFDAVFARLLNFQRAEQKIENPETGEPELIRDAVTIRKLPEFQFTGRDRRIARRLPFWFSFQSSAGLLFRTEPVFDESGAKLIDRYQTGQFMNRASVSPHITSALHIRSLHLVPSFGLHETYYAEGQTPFEDRYRITGSNMVRSARDFSLDVVFPSMARVFDRKTVFGDRLKHVIEPRATYRYVTGVGERFEKFIRFDETDLLSNTNEVLISLANRVYAKRNGSVQEILTWELYQKRYFDTTFGGALRPGRRNTFESTADLAAYAFLVGPRSASPVVSYLRFSPVGGLGISWQADYDHRYGKIVDSSAMVDYRWREYFISGGNNAVHVDPILAPAANEFRMRGGFGDSNRRGLSAAADATYNVRRGVLQNLTWQVTYNTDCCGISLQYYRYSTGQNDVRPQFRIAFSVANIGSFGNLRKQDRIF